MRKLIFTLSEMLLTMLFCFVFEIRTYGITNEEESKIKELINQYFNAQYLCQSQLCNYSLEGLYDLNSEIGKKSYNIDKEVLSYTVNYRDMQPNDLHLKDYKYQIVYKKSSIINDHAELEVIENSQVRFNFSKDKLSKKTNIQHKFMLIRLSGEWKIQSHESNDDEYKLIKDGGTQYRSYEGVKEYYLQLARDNIGKTIIKGRKFKDDKAYHNKENKLNTSIGYRNNAGKLSTYDREKVSEYAHLWASAGENLRNSPPWANYDPPNGHGDCTNFVSQCIHAGGIPMDYIGKEEQQWKWFGNSYNSSESPMGRVASWSGVNELYNYFKLNKGFGLNAKVDVDLNEMYLGDVVQFGSDDRNFFHSVIISDYIYDDTTEDLKDFFISSHTIDRDMYPLSAYSYPVRRYIHINGWAK